MNLSRPSPPLPRSCRPPTPSVAVAGALAAGCLVAVPSALAEAVAERPIEEIRVEGVAWKELEAQAGKTDVPITEYPFSVSLRDEDFFEATAAKTVQDALHYSAGVAAGPYGIDARGDWSTIRGSDPVIYIDGLKALFGFYNDSRPSVEVLERLEIMKGPSSVLYGQGTTGGIINLVSKRPEERFSGSIDVEAGSFDRRAVNVDVTGPIDAAGRWRYRGVAYYRDADAQVDHTPDDSLVLAPSLTWEPVAGTTFTLLGNLQRDESGTTAVFLPWQGTLLPNPNGQIDTDTFLSEPGWDRYDTEQRSVTLLAEHELTADWRVEANARWTRGEAEYNSMWPIFTGSGHRFEADMRTIQRTAYVSRADSRAFLYDLRIDGRFATGPAEHRLVVGYDAQEATTDNDFWYGYGQGGPIDVFDPRYGNIPTGFTVTDFAETRTDQQGIYVTDHIRVNRWILSAGGRYDEVSSSSEGSAVSDEADATTLRFGVMYELDNGLSPYASYTESFEPVAGADASGRPFDPVEGEQWELGVKYRPPGAPVLLTAAWYDIVQSNRLTQDPNDPTNQVQTGDVDLDGIELELDGRWGPFGMLASFSRIDGEVSAADVTNDLAVVPEQQASLWTTWHFSGRAEGLRVGLGVRHLGEPVEQPADLDVPDYTLIDAMAAYELGRWSLSVNARNLADDIHVTSCGARGDCYYGSRRYVTADVRYEF